jgi:CRISPR-associated protein Csm3
MTDIKLFGRVFIEAEIEARTGLHIGGSGADLEIGGLDKEVIRNPLTKRPYIPGSSLRGKMRSQTEKHLGLAQNNHIAQVTIHTCKTPEEYNKNGGCPVCHIFGIPADIGFTSPTRLIVRDIPLTDESADQLDKANTALRYAELKTEVAIDRVTSAATPRTLERIPAGAIFGPAELVYSIYERADYARFKVVIDAIQLVADDYLGGSGSRGSGKVDFKNLKVYARRSEDYSQTIDFKEFATLQNLIAAYSDLDSWLKKNIPVE